MTCLKGLCIFNSLLSSVSQKCNGLNDVLNLKPQNINLLNYLAKKNKQSFLWGIDISKENIKRAEKNKYCKREIFLQGNAEKLDFKDNFFDEVYIYEVLEHVGNLGGVLNEIKRILRIQNYLYFAESEQLTP